MPPKKTPLEQYAEIQPLVNKDISDAVAKLQKNQQYEVVKIPGHQHNGSDSPPVSFINLFGVQYHSQIQTLTLSPAQVKALFTTPIQLVVQPGARGFYVVEGISARLVYSGTAYTGANPLEFRYTNAAGQKVTDDIPATFINATASSYSYSPPVGANFTPVAGGSGNNGRIVVCVGTANPATGNSQIVISVKYHLVSFNI